MSQAGGRMHTQVKVTSGSDLWSDPDRGHAVCFQTEMTGPGNRSGHILGKSSMKVWTIVWDGLITDNQFGVHFESTEISRVQKMQVWSEFTSVWDGPGGNLGLGWSAQRSDLSVCAPPPPVRYAPPRYKAHVPLHSNSSRKDMARAFGGRK